jgi:hypothetical protein
LYLSKRFWHGPDDDTAKLDHTGSGPYIHFSSAFRDSIPPSHTHQRPSYTCEEEIQQMRKRKKNRWIYFIKESLFGSSSSLFCCLGCKIIRGKRKRGDFGVKRPNWPRLLSLYHFAASTTLSRSLSTSQFLPFGGYCTVTMNQKANVSKELNARHRKVSLPSLIEISILPLPVLDCFCVNLDFFFILIILSRFELNGDWFHMMCAMTLD